MLDECISGKRWEQIGAVIVGGWALLPPVWLFADWILFRNDVPQLEREEIRHTHDLVRNSWLGLLAVLAALFELNPLQ
jgi:hypothetical protein